MKPRRLQSDVIFSIFSVDLAMVSASFSLKAFVNIFRRRIAIGSVSPSVTYRSFAPSPLQGEGWGEGCHQRHFVARGFLRNPRFFVIHVSPWPLAGG